MTIELLVLLEVLALRLLGAMGPQLPALLSIPDASVSDLRETDLLAIPKAVVLDMGALALTVTSGSK